MYTSERVERVMSAALSIDLEESAGAVVRMFAGYPIHHLPVLSGRKVVGMLSSADVMKLDAFLPKTGVASNEYPNQYINVATLMSKPVVTIQPQQSLIDAAYLMASHGIHALPVVDAQDCLLGIVTTTDIMFATLQPVSQAHVAPPSAGGVPPSDLRLTGDAFDQAIAAAKTSVGAGQDQQGIATALLYLQQRLVLLERVLQTADRYLNCGQDHSLQVALRKVIGEARRATPSGGADMRVPFATGH